MGLVEDARRAADWVSTALTGSGYRADFGAASLAEIDRFFDENSRDGEPLTGGLIAQSPVYILFAIGAYIGEALARGLGAEWQEPGAGSDAAWNIEMRLRDGSIIWPVQRALKRLRNGEEDGIAAYGAALGLGRPVLGRATSIEELRSLVRIDGQEPPRIRRSAPPP